MITRPASRAPPRGLPAVPAALATYRCCHVSPGCFLCQEPGRGNVMHEDVRGPRAGPREPCGATRPPKMAAILASGELSPPLQALTVRTLLACWPPPACGYQRPIGPTSATPILRHACSPSATPSSAVIRDIIGPPEHHDHAPRLRAGPGPGSAPPRDHGVSRPHPRYQDRPPQHAARLRRAPPVDSAGEIPAAKITHSQSSGRLIEGNARR